jgi:type II secretory pathway pseudopilin PulG
VAGFFIMKKNSGFAILEVMLATLLLVGLIVLVMHTMSGSRQQDAARQKGEMLATVLDEVLLSDTALPTSSSNLVKNTSADSCDSDSGFLTNLAGSYLDGLDAIGFNLCADAGRTGASIQAVAPS